MRRHAQTVRDSTSSFKIVTKYFLIPQGHQNPSSGSKNTAILLKGWILPIGGVLSGRVCACRLVFNLVRHFYLVTKYPRHLKGVQKNIFFLGGGGGGGVKIFDSVHLKVNFVQFFV